MMKKSLKIIILISLFLCLSACKGQRVESLTYAVYPYLPDSEYYQELIEKRWAETEPDIKLIRAEWDCYTDGKPEGIDVMMFDADVESTIISSGWIQPVSTDDIKEREDIFPYALEGLTVDGSLYGIPVFPCGNFLIYDEGCEELAHAEHITDLSDESEMLMINCENPENRPQYIVEVMADLSGEINPVMAEGSEDIMQDIDRLAIEKHKKDDDLHVAMAYDSGTGQGYISFSESMRLLKNRADQTMIRQISFSDKENVKRLYCDAVAVSSDVKGQKNEKCLELMNVIAEAEILHALCIQNETPQYLMTARRSVYEDLARNDKLYGKLKELAEDERNHIIVNP